MESCGPYEERAHTQDVILRDPEHSGRESKDPRSLKKDRFFDFAACRQLRSE